MTRVDDGKQHLYMTDGGAEKKELSSSGPSIEQQQQLGEMEVAEAEPRARARARARARQPPRLPSDLLVDIVALCVDDAKTVVRCGLVRKDLRSAMARDPHRFRRRRGGYDPGLLVAVSYRLQSDFYIDGDGTAVVQVQPPGRLPRFDTKLLLRFDPATSTRDGLLVLRDPDNGRIATSVPFLRGLHVYDTFAGRLTSLPSTSIGLRASDVVYQPALLSVDDDSAVRSFTLLVMCHSDRELGGLGLVTQTFSLQECRWGAPREIHIHDGALPPGVQDFYEASPSTAPAVVGRSVHWLCYTDTVSLYEDSELIILAVCTESANATVIQLPEDLLVSMGSPSSWRSSWTSYAERFMLAATATATEEEGERRLSLFAAEPSVISMWTLAMHPDDGIVWSREEVIRRQEIARPLTGVFGAYKPIRFSMFGERSGTVLFWMQIGDADEAILIQLNLVTKKTLVIWRGSDYSCDDAAHALLHEISLISVLKSF